MSPEDFIGSISMFGGNYSTPVYAFCDGQLLAISQNTVLYAVIGDRFGGDGRNTVGLPDLRGRVPMHWGTGPGLTARYLAEKGGFEEVTLSVDHMPAHSHTASFEASTLNNTVATVADLPNSSVDGQLRCSTGVGNSSSPQGNFPAVSTPGSYDSGFGGEMNPSIFRGGAVTNMPITTTFTDTAISVSVGNAGSDIPFDVVQPFQAVSFVIAVEGLFPPRT